MSKPKILAIYDKGGVNFWRTYQPLNYLQKNGLADVQFCQLRFTTKDELAKKAYKADIIHTIGLVGPDGLAFIRNFKKLGVKVVFDYDDLHFNVSPFNPAYKQFGLEDVQVKNPKTGDIQYLWKDGENGFSIKDNKIKFHAYKASIQEADAITTTTLYLKQAILEISEGQGNVHVLPNAVDFEHWKPVNGIREKFPDKFRFGWAVSASHGEDWLYIKPALVKFLENHRDAKFVCIGDTHMDIRSALPKDQVEWYPFSDLWEYHYPLRMPLLGLDCAIAPLADLEFNRCKSPLKFEEYTAFGWPTIAQNMTPYTEHIINGETGLLASDIDGWVRCLESLYVNPDLRSKLHFNALMAVKSMFDIKEVAKDYVGLYQNLINNVETLTQ